MSVAELPPQFDPAQFNQTLMWTEYLNRLLGVAVGFLILATAISAWRHHRRDPKILWTTIGAFLLVGFQGWLGGRVVAHELEAWIVTVHLIVALVIVQMLLYVTVTAIPRDGQPPSSVDRGVRPWVIALIVITLVQIALGTQVRGGVDAALGAGVARSAALATVGTLDVLHRDAAFVTLVGSILLCCWLAVGNGPPHHLRQGFSDQESERHIPDGRHIVLVRWSWAVLGLAVGQVALGAVMAYVSLLPAAQVLHLTVASLLLGAQTVLLLLASSARRAGL